MMIPLLVLQNCETELGANIFDYLNERQVNYQLVKTYQQMRHLV